MHDDTPDALPYAPELHTLQSSSDVAPSPVEYLPTLQSWQSDIPAPVWNFPLVQTPQSVSPAALPYFPSEQAAQDEFEDAASAVEYCPGSHAMHALASTILTNGWYDPATQLKHIDDPGRIWYFPASQSPHVDDDEAPVLVEYRPASHGRHPDLSVTPVPVWYVPVPHTLQLVCAVEAP